MVILILVKFQLKNINFQLKLKHLTVVRVVILNVLNLTYSYTYREDKNFWKL